MPRQCSECSAIVEEERVELLDSSVCAKCAEEGKEQDQGLQGATIYGEDGVAEIQLMEPREHEAFMRLAKSRESAHNYF